MTNTFTSRALTALAAASLAVASVPTMASATKPAQETRACLITPTTMDCYPTEPVANKPRHPQRTWRSTSLRPRRLVRVRSSCTPERTTPAVLYVATTRLQWINLPAGANNATSSYKVGACATSFAANTGGGGSTFQGGAGTVATSMSSGWDNVVSSIYIT